VIFLNHTHADVINFSVYHLYELPRYLAERDRIKLLVQLIYSKIVESPWTQALTFYLQPFKFVGAINELLFDANLPQYADAYRMISKQHYNPRDAKIRYFSIGGNNSRAAWWLVRDVFPGYAELAGANQKGHVYYDLSVSQTHQVCLRVA
jgi:hypothetical protein